MIRTAILAGIFLIMLAMSYNRPGAVRDVTQAAATAMTEQPQKLAAPEKPAAEAPVLPPAIPQALAPQPVAVPAPQAHTPPAPAPQPTIAVRSTPTPSLPTPPLVNEADDEIMEDEGLPMLDEPAVRATEPEDRAPSRVAVAPPAPQEPAPLPAQTEPSPRRFAPTESATVPLNKPTRIVPLIPTQTASSAPAAEPTRGGAVTQTPTAATPVTEPATPGTAPANTAPLASADLPTVNVPTRPVALPWDAPPQSRRENGVTASATPGSTTNDETAPKFMTRQERSRELYRLAREMENTFIDKMAR